CLHKALELQPDLILMDLIMPVLDGLEATRRVRQLPQLQDVVVIALSANVLETTKRESVAAGCQDFLSKPVQVQQLLNSLMLHLGVEGIYEEDLSSREAESKCSCISIVPPPPSELLTLSKLAKIGDIQGLLDRADQLEKWDNRFVPFATQLRQLTKSFQLKQLRKFIQNYMTDKNSEFNTLNFE
ncbi:MAG: response regulator, partial [Nostoc sp. C3-bin3]|nr:response regulator [Nostoc sp. C3-bin3]